MIPTVKRGALLLWCGGALVLAGCGTSRTHDAVMVLNVERQESGTTANLRAIWADRAGETLYAVGDGGTILIGTRDGTWRPMESGTRAGLRAIAGTDSGEYLFATGDCQAGQASFLRFTGAVWQAIPTPPAACGSFGSIDASSDQEFVFAGGGSWGTYDGGTWSVHELPVGYLRRLRLDRLYQGELDGQAVGTFTDGVKVFNRATYSWQLGWLYASDGPDTSTPLNDLDEYDPVNYYVYYVGNAGTVLKRDARQGWSRLDCGTTAHLNAVRLMGEHDVWIAGDGGTLLHSDGTVCSKMESGTDARLNGVAAVWPRDAWAVGDGGTILHAWVSWDM